MIAVGHAVTPSLPVVVLDYLALLDPKSLMGAADGVSSPHGCLPLAACCAHVFCLGLTLDLPPASVGTPYSQRVRRAKLEAAG